MITLISRRNGCFWTKIFTIILERVELLCSALIWVTQVAQLEHIVRTSIQIHSNIIDNNQHFENKTKWKFDSSHPLCTLVKFRCKTVRKSPSNESYISTRKTENSISEDVKMNFLMTLCWTMRVMQTFTKFYEWIEETRKRYRRRLSDLLMLIKSNNPKSSRSILQNTWRKKLAKWSCFRGHTGLI